MFPIEPNLNGWSGEAFFAAVRRTRERERQRSPAKDLRKQWERMMRGEPRPVEVRGLYFDGVWIDELRHVEFDRHVNDALVYGLGAMNVTPTGIRYVPFQAVVSPPSTCTLAKAVRACVGIPEPELAKVDSDYVRAV